MEGGKKGQISTEYLIIVGFVTFMVIALLGLAFFYISSIRDDLKINQIDNFGKKIVNSAEGVYFAGEPSKVTIILYMPKGVQDITVTGINNDELTITIQTDTGVNVISYPSNVPLSWSGVTFTDGIKKIRLTAEANGVSIAQV